MDLNEKETTPPSFGAKLAIVAFVFAQFVNVTFFHVGQTAISVQKIAGVLFLPLALVLMRRVRVNLHLIVLALLLSTMFSAWYIVAGEYSSRLISANAFVLSTGFAAVVLYTALTEGPAAVELLGRVWVWASVLTGLLTITLVLDPVSFYFKPGETGLAHDLFGYSLAAFRGTGLKTDPNFQAMMLNIGLAFVFHYSQQWRWLFVSIILGGVLATASRGGLLTTIGLLIIGVCQNPNFFRTVQKNKLIPLGILVFLGAMAIQFGSGIAGRMGDIPRAIMSVVSGEIYSSRARILTASSPEQRLMICTEAVRLGAENWEHGVGAFRGPDVLWTSYQTRERNQCDTTPLDWFMIGGVFGLTAYGYYWWMVARSWRQLKSEYSILKQRDLIILMSVAFFVSTLFITVGTNSIIWLLPVTALAIWRNSGQAAGPELALGRLEKVARDG